MSSTYTNYGRDFIQAALLTPDTFAAPSGLWLALSLSLLVKNSTSDMIDEPDPTCGYHRLAVPIGSAFWVANGFGEFSLSSGTSDELTITTDSGLILGWALADSSTINEGNLFAVGTLNSPIVLTIAASPYTADDLTMGLYD